ncbi:aminoacyl-tRNA hydrolase [Chloroflexota bacterium]
MKIIVGLGNPGRTYARNRHNIGFMCLNHLTKKLGIKLDKKQGQTRTGTGKIAGIKLLVARPQTSMNLSGQAVKWLVKKFNLNLNDLIIIHDDLDLPTGKIRLNQGSGSGGHKGVDSIITQLGSADFIRIRIGISRPPDTESPHADKEAEIIDHVLNDFTPEEKRIINKIIPEVSAAILCLIAEGLTPAMNKYN